MRNHIGRLAAAMLLTASVAALSASSALATPTGEFAPFVQCPLSNAELAACLVANSTSGEFTVGSKTVPLTKTITLQGGFTENEKEEMAFVGAANGVTVSKTPETVPGGL